MTRNGRLLSGRAGTCCSPFGGHAMSRVTGGSMPRLEARIAVISVALMPNNRIHFEVMRISPQGMTQNGGECLADGRSVGRSQSHSQNASGRLAPDNGLNGLF